MNNTQIIDAALQNAGFTALNDLQKRSVELADKNENLLILSQTGSGKTLAFLLPILLKLETGSNQIQAMVLAPTRELAIQIENVFRSLKTNHKVLTCYGGHSMKVEQKSLSEAPSLLIGTPGRICDHISRGNLNLTGVKQLLIDEYDKCLEFGFEDQIKYIINELTNLKNTTLVSATELESFPDYIDFSKSEKIDFLSKSEQPDINYFKVSVSKDKRMDQLLDLLCSFKGELTIVFCNYRETTEMISEYLESRAYPSLVYHGGLEQEDRERTLIKFRNGSYHTLICTDLGSRGLDIPEIQHVVHFQYPQNKEAFIHRNGRTARMKANGSSYLLTESSGDLPEYLKEEEYKALIPKGNNPVPESKWITLYFSGGRKDKINKIDIVGFLGQKGHLKKDNIGLISVLDYSSYVAVHSENIEKLLSLIRKEKVKGQKLRIAVSK